MAKEAIGMLQTEIHYYITCASIHAYKSDLFYIRWICCTFELQYTGGARRPSVERVTKWHGGGTSGLSIIKMIDKIEINIKHNATDARCGVAWRGVAWSNNTMRENEV